MKRELALSLAVMLLPLSAAAAAEPTDETTAEPRKIGEEASIVFPSNSSIRNWQADRDRGIWIQDRKRDWYYGTFAGFCRDLDFARVIAVDAPGAGRLDRFATILVRGQRCPLTSFVTSEGPPSKKGKEAS